jgi:hypothetical protein
MADRGGLSENLHISKVYIIFYISFNFETIFLMNWLWWELSRVQGQVPLSFYSIGDTIDKKGLKSPLSRYFHRVDKNI